MVAAISICRKFRAWITIIATTVCIENAFSKMKKALGEYQVKIK